MEAPAPELPWDVPVRMAALPKRVGKRNMRKRWRGDAGAHGPRVQCAAAFACGGGYMLLRHRQSGFPSAWAVPRNPPQIGTRKARPVALQPERRSCGSCIRFCPKDGRCSNQTNRSATFRLPSAHGHSE